MSEKQFPAPFTAQADREPPGTQDRLQELALAMLRETLVLRELLDALSEQRAAVAAGEIKALNECTKQVSAIVNDLEAARANRRGLMLAAGAHQDTPVASLQASLGSEITPVFERVHADLMRAARDATQELAINRRVLERALERSESLMRTVFAAAGEEPGVYRSPANRSERLEPGAVFVNRVA